VAARIWRPARALAGSAIPAVSWAKAIACAPAIAAGSLCYPRMRSIWA